MKQVGRLFSPFQRFHCRDEFPGAGVGLSTVKRIVFRHRGRVWGESQDGGGATFSFTLGERRGAAMNDRVHKADNGKSDCTRSTASLVHLALLSPEASQAQQVHPGVEDSPGDEALSLRALAGADMADFQLRFPAHPGVSNPFCSPKRSMLDRCRWKKVTTARKEARATESAGASDG